MKKVLGYAVAGYLFVGLMFALFVWVPELRVFECGDTVEGWGSSYRNPDPARCTRRGFTVRSVSQIPLFVTAWPYIIGERVFHESGTSSSHEIHEVYRAPYVTQTLPPVTLTDGEHTEAGTFYDSPVTHGRKSFTSETLGISFTYPSDHVLFVRESADGDIQYISIMPQESAIDTFTRIRAGHGGGEWPPGIMFTFFDASNQSIPLEEWVRTDSRSNFALALPPWEEQENTLTPTTVSGVPAFAYRNDGLYSFDYIAFKHRSWFVLASGASHTATPNPHFQSIIDSTHLTETP